MEHLGFLVIQIHLNPEITVQTLVRGNSHFMVGLLWQLLQLLALMSFPFTWCQHRPVS